MDDREVEVLFGDFDSGFKARTGHLSSRLDYVKLLWEQALNQLSAQETAQAKSVLEFAKSISYNHVGVSSQEYLLHPIRVASFGGLLNIGNRLLSIKTGLLHNVYELADVTSENIIAVCGETVDLALKTLRVDRGRQNDCDYLENYYKAIVLLPNNLGIIKVLDKIDNLYTLNMTAPKSIKNSYLDEINKFLTPLSRRISPFLNNTLSNLVEALN